MATTLVLWVNEDGSIEHVYDDALADLFEADGQAATRRASHVEPCAGGWAADLSPVGGPTLGPFKTRAAALEAEVAWLGVRMALGPLAGTKKEQR